MSACCCLLLPLLVLLPCRALCPGFRLTSLLCGSSCAEYEHTALPANKAAVLGNQGGIKQQQPPRRSEPAHHPVRGKETAELPSCCFVVGWQQQQLWKRSSCCNMRAWFGFLVQTFGVFVQLKLFTGGLSLVNQRKVLAAV